MRPGNKVRLHIPDNPTLDGRLVSVAEVTDYGAIVSGTGVGTGEFRALHEEMMPYAQVNGKQRATVQAKDMGYIGEICSRCGSMRVKRAGACSVCEECGHSDGCG